MITVDFITALFSLGLRAWGGRRPKLTPRQTQRLVALSAAGPLVGGLETAWGTSVLLRVLLWHELGLLSQRQDVGTLLHTLGFALHKARVVSAQLDTAKRLAWLEEQWPARGRVPHGPQD